ncbi:phosphopantetheine-binding protein [Actinophytocola sp.]|jgi:acyl carrier protein|uniref:phosphopantetheine-binding protein n=1 Tax=Actinophytocola sp. TaxID=1872138 RepID=UPI002ED840CE
MANVSFDDIESILVKKVGLAPQTLADTPENSLEDLGLDSLAVLELQIVITKQYGVEIPDESGALNVGEIVELINKAAEQAA